MQYIGVSAGTSDTFKKSQGSQMIKTRNKEVLPYMIEAQILQTILSFNHRLLFKNTAEKKIVVLALAFFRLFFFHKPSFLHGLATYLVNEGLL